MSDSKRFYWLKLHADFFDEKYIKALRRLPQGDSLTIVYLKMQLKSLRTEGLIRYEGILPDSMAELAMALDEDEHITKLAVEALIRFGVVERWDDETLYMSAMQHMIGSESASAERVRRHRALKKDMEALHGNTSVTACNTEIEIEIEKEKTKETEERQSADIGSVPEPADKPPRTPRFSPPSVDEVAAYCKERHNGVDPRRFVDFYTANGWTQGRGKSIKDWRAAVRTWERNGYDGKSSCNVFLDIAREEGLT